MRSATLGFLLLSTVCGCGSDPKCDPGQTEKAGVCVDENDDAAGGTSSNASGSAGETTTQGQAGSPGGSAEEGFGTTCTTNDDCADPAPYCAKSPMDTTGYCTVTGCMADATLCPAGWTCNTVYMTYGAPDFCAPE
jgi:hypothetical protein